MKLSSQTASSSSSPPELELGGMERTTPFRGCVDVRVIVVEEEEEGEEGEVEMEMVGDLAKWMNFRGSGH